MKRLAVLLALFLALLAALALKGSLLALPSPPAQPSAGEFDANRAAARLARILGDERPHPADSFNGDAVRGRLIGARAFVAHDPLARQVGWAINLESRGVEGPAIMFETSRPNGPAIAWFARAGGRPVANSLSTDLYRLIPNSTDVAVFAERPWT